MHSSCLLGTFLLFLTIAMAYEPSIEGCEREQVRQGCKIQDGKCVCGSGCYMQFRFNNKEECKKALKGRKVDYCQRSPCLHGGTCSQITQEPGFRCRCEGTGYYGTRCQFNCPRPGQPFPRGERSFPYECIVI
ncbi:hypothetical protein LSTR_LSTR002102 [Laodelphax striatellus]|uniref:EGF-like domain-containing protein n=1 Tax=Laodelphax striatellus TaxID=195883 RepID=A0A482XQI4_LAOST|nr:hypothetical protein LSTR_LSTR002102 [Laodelphax striatellus]